MTTLHLGVIDIPYSQAPNPRQRRPRSNVTTGDVAGWLEDRYHVMELFFEEHASDVVAPALEKSVAGAITSLMSGAPVTIDPFGSATSKIEDAFKQFLSTGEAERLGIPGVPTQAALRGVNHRMARPYARRASRPSFIDTGLYQSTFKAWFTP